MVWIYYVWKYIWPLSGHLCSWDIHTTKISCSSFFTRKTLAIVRKNFLCMNKICWNVCWTKSKTLSSIYGSTEYAETACLNCFQNLFSEFCSLGFTLYWTNGDRVYNPSRLHKKISFPMRLFIIFWSKLI